MSPRKQSLKYIQTYLKTGIGLSDVVIKPQVCLITQNQKSPLKTTVGLRYTRRLRDRDQNIQSKSTILAQFNLIATKRWNTI